MPVGRFVSRSVAAIRTQPILVVIGPGYWRPDSPPIPWLEDLSGGISAPIKPLDLTKGLEYFVFVYPLGMYPYRLR